MKLLMIEGGRGGADLAKHVPRSPTAADVQAEARRRICLSGYDAWRVREFATGAAMPKSIRHLQLQISFAADRLARLDDIPADFRSDLYWPVG